MVLRPVFGILAVTFIPLAGDAIEVLYDPAEPANFEPASLTSARR